MKRILQRWPCGAVAVGSVGNAAWAEEKPAAPAATAPAAAAPAVAAPAAADAAAPAAAPRRSPTRVTTPGSRWRRAGDPDVDPRPGALFYGGLVRSKNMLSVLMQVFVTFSLISILWVIYGYRWPSPRAATSSRDARQAVPEGRHRRLGGGDLLEGRRGLRVRLRDLPGRLRGDHLRPHRRRLRRAREVLGRAGVHGDLVHPVVPADGAHGLVLGGSGCLHRCGCGRTRGQDGGLPVPEGCARLRRRYRGAYQRRVSPASSVPS